MMLAIKTTCPDCREDNWFAPIGRANGGSYRCQGCGNIEQNPHCEECGCNTFFRSKPFGRTTRCRSCGCTKEPVFGT